jgi:hypothetical protein
MCSVFYLEDGRAWAASPGAWPEQVRLPEAGVRQSNATRPQRF